MTNKKKNNKKSSAALASQQEQQQEESKTIPLKIIVDKQSNKVLFVEATKDFVDTLFSFLSLPLATIVRLLANNNQNNDQQKQLSESSPFLENIKKLYQTVENLNSDDVWNTTFCKQMLLNPRNPCESMCMKLLLNIDDTEPSNKFYVCDSCNKFTTFRNLHCTCGKQLNKQPRDLDSEGQENVNSADAQNGSKFLVSDDLKIVPCSSMTYMLLLMELGYSDLTQIEEVTQNIGKKEILNLLKYTLTSGEPLTNAILASSFKNKDNPPKQSASRIRVIPFTNNRSKIDVKVVQSKSQKKIIFAEANGDFVDFIFSFLTMPLGSIVKLLGDNSFDGCVGNLYKSVENLDPFSVLLNPGIAPQFGFPNQPLNIPHVEHPTYYYGTGTPKRNIAHPGYPNLFNNPLGEHPPYYCINGYLYPLIEEKIEGGVLSKSRGSICSSKSLIALDPKSANRSKEGVEGFVKRDGFYCVGDDLKVKPLSVYSHLSYLKELSLPLDDLEVKLISIGEAEALNFLGAFLTSKFTLTSGLGDLSEVPKLKLIDESKISNPFYNGIFKTPPHFQHQKEKISLFTPSHATMPRSYPFGSSHSSFSTTTNPTSAASSSSSLSFPFTPSPSSFSTSLLSAPSSSSTAPSSIFSSTTVGSPFGGGAPSSPTNHFGPAWDSTTTSATLFRGAASISNMASPPTLGASPASSMPFGAPSSTSSTPSFGV